MTVLRFRLLGVPGIALDEKPVIPTRRKTSALLYYLAERGTPLQRGPAAGLLWPEFSPEQARANLRRTIQDANEVTQHRLFEPVRDLLRFSSLLTVEVDALRFMELAARGLGRRLEEGLDELLQAASLYMGDFLSGFYLKDAMEYEDWQLGQLDLYRQKAITILDKLVCGYRIKGRWNKAEELAERMIRYAPLHEAGHRHIVEMLADRGETSAARAHFEVYSATLEKELGAKPEASFAQLYEQLKNGRYVPVPHQPWPSRC
jgi:DNA-binding SARP family transcriptional activator